MYMTRASGAAEGEPGRRSDVPSSTLTLTLKDCTIELIDYLAVPIEIHLSLRDVKGAVQKEKVWCLMLASLIVLIRLYIAEAVYVGHTRNLFYKGPVIRDKN